MNVVSGGRMKCRRCREPAVIDVPPPQRGLLRRLLHASLPRAGAARDRRPRHDRARRPRARRGVGRQGLARAVAAAARARLRRRRPVRRARDRRVLRRVGRVRASVRREARLAAARGRPARHVRVRRSRRRRRRSGACRARRAGCRSATCSTTPRSTNGYDVLATGHNLDDEAAVLLGNVLRWDAGYLGRQHPVLPAAPGFVRKVKPLVRLGERELAAYCVLAGIDYIVEECPMAAGNRHLGYKELLNEIEERSPGTKAAFLFGFIERGHERFAGRRGGGTRRPAPVPGVRAPTPADVCAFCRLRRAGDPAASRYGSRRDRPRERSRPATRCCSSTTRSGATS